MREKIKELYRKDAEIRKESQRRKQKDGKNMVGKNIFLIFLPLLLYVLSG
jgi:hypothetical protein